MSSVFTSRNLATDFNTGTVTVSLNYSLQISLYYSAYKDFSSPPDLQLSTELSTLLHHLSSANPGTLNPVLSCNCQLSHCHLRSTLDSREFINSIPKVICWQAGVSKLNWLKTIYFVLYITSLHGPRRKHSLSIVEEACLPRARVCRALAQKRVV
jgi:hypothetical protein